MALYTTLKALRANRASFDSYNRLVCRLRHEEFVAGKQAYARFNYREKIYIGYILESNGIYDAVWALCACEQTPELHRTMRLYVVWCARQVQQFMTDQRSIDALDVAERHANGDATDEELRDATRYARAASIDADCAAMYARDALASRYTRAASIDADWAALASRAALATVDADWAALASRAAGAADWASLASRAALAAVDALATRAAGASRDAARAARASRAALASMAALAAVDAIEYADWTAARASRDAARAARAAAGATGDAARVAQTQKFIEMFCGDDAPNIS